MSTGDRSQEGIEGGVEDSTFLPPKEPDDPVMLPHRLPFHRVVVGSNHKLHFEDGGRQPLLHEGQYDSDLALPGVFSVRRAPFDEQFNFKGISKYEPVVKVVENAHALFSQGNKGCLSATFHEDTG